jgi:phosphotransferase system HPr-like phosphotransfer protein
MQNADSFMDRNILEIDSYVRLINGRNVNLNSAIELITTTIKTSDEVQLMNFYS